MKFLTGIVCITTILAACNSNQTQLRSESIPFKVINLNDQQYPDNPDIGFRSINYKFNYFGEGYILPEANNYSIHFQSLNSKDTISLIDIDLFEFIPTIPNHLKENEYAAYLALVNQEWNRNQVKFTGTEFRSTDKDIVRVDLARNCLNAYLWEVILYVHENGSETPYAHGWFDFPRSLYRSLFQKKNGLDYSKYQKALENWIDPKNEKIDENLFAQVVDTIDVQYLDKSDGMYPVKGARESKFKEIIFPKKVTSMKDLQDDKTLFATFSPPGIYTKKDPRKTELGRIYHLKNVNLTKVRSTTNGKLYHTFHLVFNDKEKKRNTQLILGGLSLDDFPFLNEDDANEGWKSSMGFSNHSFYESYGAHIKCKSIQNPYYAYLSDGKGNWLDSHKIGIDGPLIHWDKDEKNLLHIWLLSFERHALVGHYTIKISQ